MGFKMTLVQKLRALLVAGLAVGGLSAAVTPGLADERLDFEQITGLNGPVDAGSYVATTDSEWRAIWSLLDVTPPKSLSEGKETAVALFLGQKPSRGYGYQIRRIVKDDDGRIEVKAVRIVPAGATVQGESAPYVVVLIQGTGERVILEDRSELMPVHTGAAQAKP